MRTLALSNLCNNAGNGLLMATLVLFFTGPVGLGAGAVAAGLSIGAGVGLLVGVPLGHLADRWGAREVAVAVQLAQTAATGAYLLVGSAGAFIAVATIEVALARGASAVRQGIIARALPDEGRVEARALLRAVTNAGAALGTGLAAIGIAVGTRAGYEVMIALDALSFVAVAALTRQLPHLAGVPASASGPALVVLRDRPYLAAIAMTALLHVHNAILTVGLPLWVAAHTRAPEAMVGVIFTVNCLVVMAFSIRVARGTDTPAQGARAALRAGAWLAAACALLALSSSPPALVAALVLLVGMLLQAVGEMFQAASQWSLSLGLAPGDRHGQYQGAAATALNVGDALGPLVMAAVVAGGSLGWIALGGAFLAAGALHAPVVAWAQSSHGV